jgi:predicted DNA binding CopG/RHH family protein
MIPLDPEEQAILESVENDEWHPVPEMMQEIQRYQRYAKAHLSGLEEVKIEIPVGDLRSLQALAQQSGLSVPTLVASVIHQYVTNLSQPQP